MYSVHVYAITQNQVCLFNYRSIITCVWNFIVKKIHSSRDMYRFTVYDDTYSLFSVYLKTYIALLAVVSCLHIHMAVVTVVDEPITALVVQLIEHGHC